MIATVCDWLDSCRRKLELMLLDVGGKHTLGNDVLLRSASHFTVMAREDDPAGMQSWWTVRCRLGLAPAARVRSLWQTGGPTATRDPAGLIEAGLRADVCTPADRANDPVVDFIVEALRELRRDRPAPAYLNLRLERDWLPADLADLGGLAPRLGALVASPPGP